MLHNESNCYTLSDRRDMHLLSYAHTLASNPVFIDNRNLPTRINQGKRLNIIRSLKPVVIRSARYRAITRWNLLKADYTVIEDLSAFKLASKKNYPDCFM